VNRTSSIRPPDSSNVSAVHIFDLDETLIQFNHLGSLYIPPRQLVPRTPGEAATPPDRTAGKAVSAALEDLIFGLATAHFFFDDLDGCNQTDVRALGHVDDRAPLDALDFDEDGFTWPKGAPPGLAHPAWTRLAHRLRAMEERYAKAAGTAGAAARRPPTAAATIASHVAKHKYEKTSEKSLSFSARAPVDVLQTADSGWVRVQIGADEGWAPASYLSPVETNEAFPEVAALGTAGMLSDEQATAVANLHRDLTAYTEGWLDTALRLLHALQHVQGCELVLVTNSELAAALTKCLLFRLGPYFRPENIYSSVTAGKPAVFQRIQERFGHEPHYCAYGDGDEERRAAEGLQMAFRPVGHVADLQKLCRQAELNDGRVN
jgi:FMN phosphatase YigB (HAD superfamily)